MRMRLFACARDFYRKVARAGVNLGNLEIC